MLFCHVVISRAAAVDTASGCAGLQWTSPSGIGLAQVFGQRAMEGDSKEEDLEREIIWWDSRRTAQGTRLLRGRRFSDETWAVEAGQSRGPGRRPSPLGPQLLVQRLRGGHAPTPGDFVNQTGLRLLWGGSSAA